MPIIPTIGNQIRAIERLTNDLAQGQRRPKREALRDQQHVTDGPGPSSPTLLSEKKIVSEISAKEGVKANVKLIQAADEMVGSIIDLKV